MATILAICGSLRQGSYNLMLQHAARAATPAGSTMDIVSIRDVPLYDGDEESSHGIPPFVLKNAIDWMSRPPADIARVFRGRPVALIGATPGAGGTMLAQAAWLPIIRTLGMRPWFDGRLMMSRAADVFDGQGAVIDQPTAARIRAFVEGFVAFAAGART